MYMYACTVMDVHATPRPTTINRISHQSDRVCGNTSPLARLLLREHQSSSASTHTPDAAYAHANRVAGSAGSAAESKRWARVKPLETA